MFSCDPNPLAMVEGSALGDLNETEPTSVFQGFLNLWPRDHIQKLLPGELERKELLLRVVLKLYLLLVLPVIKGSSLPCSPSHSMPLCPVRVGFLPLATQER